MDYRRELKYDASPAEVWAMVTDPGFREKVGAAQHVVSTDVTITPQGAGATVVIDQVQDTAGLPSIAKKIVGDTTQAIVREEWTSPTSGSIEIVAPGKPTKGTGTIAIESDGAGSVYIQALQLTVKVPLIAGKLEKVMADNIDAGLTVEHAVGVAWLKGDR